MKLHWTIAVPFDRNKGMPGLPKSVIWHQLAGWQENTRYIQENKPSEKQQCMGVWSLFIIDILKNGMLLSHLKRIEASRLQQSMHSEHFMSSEWSQAQKGSCKDLTEAESPKVAART